MDPSSILLGALFVSAKVLGIGAVGFGIAWWRGRNRIRRLEAQRQPDPLPLVTRMNRLESGLDSVAAALPPLRISVMVAVPDAPTAVAWYKRALGAVELWNLGSVVGLEVAGAPFFVGQPEKNGWESPAKLGITTTRIEVFCADPDSFIARAVEAGANGSVDRIRNHAMPWGPHRQGGFVDPFGHIWLVGDRSPLSPHRAL